MIRGSRHGLALANAGKRAVVQTVVQEFRRVVQVILDDIWVNGLPAWDYFPGNNKLECKATFLETSYLSNVQTWLSARLKQVAGKQALQMLKAATEKRRKQLWKLADLQKKGVAARGLQSGIDRQPLVKPDASRANLDLDARFVDFQQQGRFLFVRLASLGKKLQVLLPIQETKVSTKWAKSGTRKQMIRLSEDNVELVYEVPDAPKTGTRVVGADQGVTTTLSLSNGLTTQPDKHGHSLGSIQQTLARRQKGSKAFGRSQVHRKNYINWSLNQLRGSFASVKEVRLEKVKNLRRGRKSSRFLSHWCYPLIKEKLMRLSEEEGFNLIEVPNMFRSQRCQQCGWVRKANRKGKTFKCTLCLFQADADLNAATNLELDLYEIPIWVRQQQLNRSGFYWTTTGLRTAGQEPIVPVTQKATLEVKYHMFANYQRD